MKPSVILRNVLLGFIFYFSSVASLDGQVIQWLTQGGGNDNDYSTGITLDAQGNLYTIGTFTGTAVFGTYTISSTGKGDVFVTRADAATGNITWAKKIGSSAEDHGTAITADLNGNIYCTGRFSGTITAGATSYSATGLSEAFVAKLDPATGAIAWLKRMGGTGSDNGSAVATDAAGNVYTTGYFQGTATFGTYTLMPAGNNFNAFVAKTDAAGNFLWASSLGGSGYTFGNALASGSGKIYVTGSMESSAMFGNYTLTSKGNTDIFIATLDDTNGNTLSAESFGGSGNDVGNAILTKPGGEVYTTGKFEGTVVFGSDTLASSGSSDSFTIKQNAAGALVWVNRVGGTGYDSANAISYDGTGNIYITGQFGSVLPLSSSTFYASGIADVYVARINDVSGTASAGMQLGGAGADIGTAVARDAAGDIYLSGSFQTTAAFETSTLTAAGNADVFTLKLNAATVGIRKTTAALKELYVSPNPFQQELQVVLPVKPLIACYITVTDALGSVLIERKETGAAFTLDLEKLDAGIYYLSVLTNTGATRVKKIIKD